MLQRGAETGKVGPKGPDWSREGWVILKSGVFRDRIGGPDWESKRGDTRQARLARPIVMWKAKFTPHTIL
jgi:hypothetical protein